MFGSHLSIAGGLHHALVSARELSMDCVQIFTKNQRQWKVRPLADDEVKLWQQRRHDTGIDNVVSHDSYLINLASPTDEAWEKSIALFREELLRCEALEIGCMVTHPGAHMQMGEEHGLKRVAAALDRLHAELPGLKVVTCLEVTAGQGSSLGYRFEHLRDIIQAVKQPERLAVCLDTAHLLAAGYDLTAAAAARAVMQELDAVLGLHQVQVIHLNDSKVKLGSRVDRHEHIGGGYVALEAFGVLVNLPEFQGVPKILETPKGTAEDGTAWDTVNLKKLQELRKGRPGRQGRQKAGAKRPSRRNR